MWCARSFIASHRAAPVCASTARRYKGPLSRLPEPVAARPSRRHRPASWAARHDESQGPVLHRDEPARSACGVLAARRHAADLMTGRPARPCRPARAHTHCDACRRNSSGLQPAVELRLRKNLLASLRISLAQRTFLTLRSNSFIRCESVVVTPSRTPASTSAHLPHTFNFCGTQAILGAMDSMATHSEGCPPRSS